MRQIILDTETTGLEPSQGHRIIEIAAMEMINRRLTGNYLHYYINPQRIIDEGAKKVHGITEKFLEDKPLFQDIADELFTYLNNSDLIIHNAPFDIGFLDHEFQQVNKKFPKIAHCCTVTDTLVIARKKHRGQKNNLDALCKRYQVDNTQRDLHGALIDVKLLADVYIAMTTEQMSLFGTDMPLEDVTVTIQSTHATIPISDTTLKILHASPDELAAHTAYHEQK